MTYFHFVRHGPHTKRRVQQLLYFCLCVIVAAVTFLPNRYLALGTGGCELDTFDSGYGPLIGCWEHGREPLG
jgi:hypothetical protein